jgi:hypothetical protein
MHRTWKSGNKLVFSLCRYPFLFSTTAKINILHIHAEHEMGIQVNQVRPATNILLLLFATHCRILLMPCVSCWQAYAQALSGQDGTLPVLVIVVRRQLLIQDALAQVSELQTPSHDSSPS